MEKLNVGCGRNILEGWINIDKSIRPVGSSANIKFDLEECRTKQMPLPDDSIDEFLLSHVIEHIKDSLALMQELYRVAKPDAICVIRVPYGSSDDAWEDPTHVRPYFIGSFGYFSQPFYWRADYGYRGDWKVESIELNVQASHCAAMGPAQILAHVKNLRNMVKEMVVKLTAIKPIREAKSELQTQANISFNLV